jgi:hypothetical protein
MEETIRDSEIRCKPPSASSLLLIIPQGSALALAFAFAFALAVVCLFVCHPVGICCCRCLVVAVVVAFVVAVVVAVEVERGFSLASKTRREAASTLPKAGAKGEAEATKYCLCRCLSSPTRPKPCQPQNPPKPAPDKGNHVA